MAKQSASSKQALVIVGVIVVVLVVVVLMQGNNKPMSPTSTQPTANGAPVTTPTSEAVREQTDGGSAVIEAPAPATTLAAPAIDAAAIDTALQALDGSLTEAEYDAGTVTELFEEAPAESLTEEYEL